MQIRPVTEPDLGPAVDLVIATFRPYYEDFVRPMFGEVIFAHQHGQWEQDYRDEVPTLHDPASGRLCAVAETEGGIIGLVAWKVGEKAHHGEIHLLAVSASGRREQVGRTLCEHAIAAMKTDGVEVVGIGTGDDPFHTAARTLYESLGFLKVPIAGYLKRI